MLARGLALILALVLLPACILDLSDDDDDASDRDGSHTGSEVGRVDTGLIESRELSALSADETDAVCETIGAASQRVREHGGAAYCQLSGLLGGRAAIEESGLATARATCNQIVSDCLDATGELTCSRSGLERWAACGLTVGRVEDCLTADNAHVLDQLARIEADTLSCDDLALEHPIFDPDPVADAACEAVDACQ